MYAEPITRSRRFFPGTWNSSWKSAWKYNAFIYATIILIDSDLNQDLIQFVIKTTAFTTNQRFIDNANHYPYYYDYMSFQRN